MEDFILKLDKINWTKFDFDTNSLTSDNGFKVSYRLTLNCLTKFVPRWQIVITLTYNDSLVMNYGCDTYENQDKFGKWFLYNKSKARELEYDRENKNQSIGREIFSNL